MWTQYHDYDPPQYFRIFGRPAPKGSYRAVKTKKGGTRFIPASKYEKQWRESVAMQVGVYEYEPFPPHVPLVICLNFVIPRPKSVKRSLPTVPPDLDKLTRSTLDALQDTDLLPDDAQIIHIEADKRYQRDDEEEPGVFIYIAKVINEKTA